ncbi:MAG TPA: response regulator transcription factor [Turneriella sp.]|nr:response regulator transcription factor [Turneriella sp.]
MSREKHIAIVEDDDSIRELLAEHLKEAGYRVSAFFSAEQLERKLDAQYNLTLLDIMLPGKSGLQLLKDIRAKGVDFPVILITASESDVHIDAALSDGANDYIVKPFNLKHLLLKIENLFHQIDAKNQSESNDVYTLGAGKFEVGLQTVLRNKKEYKLTPSEAATLMYFIENSNRIISRDELQEHIGAHAKAISSRNLDNYILKFRKLFEFDPKDPVLFVTIPRKGYALKR